MTTPVLAPVWTPRPVISAVWVAKAETPEWIADRTDHLLTGLQRLFGIPHWDTARGHRWEGTDAALADIVRKNPVHEALPEGEDGEVLAGEGYSMVLQGTGPSVSMNVSISAGSLSAGRRLPRHTLHIDLRETAPGGLTSELGDAACSTVASTWSPSTVKLADSATNSLARRGNWKIGIGYRTWISAEVGAVIHAAEGITASDLTGGTMISAPDDWPADRVVAAMTQTLEANGLDEIPH